MCIANTDNDTEKQCVCFRNAVSLSLSMELLCWPWVHEFLHGAPAVARCNQANGGLLASLQYRPLYKNVSNKQEDDAYNP